jgi:hypothetical protein
VATIELEELRDYTSIFIDRSIDHYYGLPWMQLVAVKSSSRPREGDRAMVQGEQWFLATKDWGVISLKFLS